MVTENKFYVKGTITRYSCATPVPRNKLFIFSELQGFKKLRCTLSDTHRTVMTVRRANLQMGKPLP